MWGILVGTFLVFAITGLFNVYLYENLRIVTQVIGVIGGLFIIYLAIRMFITRNDDEKLMIKNDKLFVMAVILNFVNAKTIIFGLTVAAYYLEMGFPAQHMLPFAGLMAVLCFVSVISWGLFGKIFKDFLTRYRLVYNIVMSLLLAYSGVIIIVESFTA